MSVLVYFLIFYGVISLVSICVFSYEVKHAYHVDPDDYFLEGDTTVDSLENKN